MRRGAVFAMAATVAALALGAAPAAGQGGQAGQGGLDCQRCHGEPELLRQYVDALDDARALTVRSPMLDGSAHAGMTCSECHTGFARYPHPGTAATESCAGCHEAVRADWSRGLHSGSGEGVGVGGGVGGGESVACAACHGIHDVVPADSLREGRALLVLSETCAGCHETQRLPVDAHHQDHAGCSACHNPHGVLSPSDPESWMAPANQARVCGACHDSVATIWSGGVHARVLRSGEYDEVEHGPPGCTACHGAHPVAGSGDVGAFEAELDRCAECHEEAARTYNGTYHGKASTLGSGVAATCSDCHGAHGIEPASEPGSRVAAANLVDTCRDCHEHARPAFVKYDAHPDPMNRERNPALFYSFWFMNSLLIGTLLVFGLHTLLWWIRITIDERRGVTHHGGGGGE